MMKSEMAGEKELQWRIVYKAACASTVVMPTIKSGRCEPLRSADLRLHIQRYDELLESVREEKMCLINPPELFSPPVRNKGMLLQ